MCEQSLCECCMRLYNGKCVSEVCRSDACASEVCVSEVCRNDYV